MSSCSVCGLVANSQLVTCILCGKQCHLKCTIARKTTVPIKCNACHPRKPRMSLPRVSIKASITPPPTTLPSSSSTRSRPSPRPSCSTGLPPSSGSSPNPSPPSTKSRPSSDPSFSTSSSSSPSPLSLPPPSPQMLNGTQASEAVTPVIPPYRRYSYELDATIVRSGSVISSLVEYSSKTLSIIGDATDKFNRAMADGLAEINGKINTLPAMSEKLSSLLSKLEVMETIVNKQSSTLEELVRVNRSLVDENKDLSQRISSLEKKLSTGEEHRWVRADSVMSRSDDTCVPPPILSSALRPSDSAGETQSAVLDQGNEIIVTDAARTDAPESAYDDMTFAVLNSLLPSLEREDIVAVRALPSRSAVRRTVGTGEGSGSDSSKHLPTSLRVCLRERRVKNSILRAKRAINYFTGSDVNTQLLPEESHGYLLKGKIFINDALSQGKYRQFLSLKQVARDLGFKYVWHSGGSFFVRKKSGESAHTFSTASDLDAIARALSGGRRGSLPPPPERPSEKHSE